MNMIIMLLLQVRNVAHYLKNNVLKTLTFTEGAYKVNHINAIIQQKVPNESIKLVIDQGSARCKIVLKQGYKIDFTGNDTFRDILGFDAVIVDQALTESPKICDFVISTNNFITPFYIDFMYYLYQF